jgi:hypothetical protein
VSRTLDLLAQQHAARTRTNPHADTPASVGAILNPGPTKTGQLLYWNGSIWTMLPGVLWTKSGAVYTLDVQDDGAADLKLNCGTQKTLELVQPVYQDIDFPIIIRTTGAGIPSLAALNGNITAPQWQVNDVNICESQELIHAWEEGTACSWHLHLTTNGSDAGDTYVRFEVEYGYVDVNGAWVFPATLDSGDLLIPGGTATKTMLILALGSFTPAIHIGGHVIARLKRITATGTAPTGDPWVPMLQMHVRCNTLGSRQITAK